MIRRSTALRRAALVAAVVPLLAACQDALTNEKLNPRPDPAGGALFRNYVALGTSISMGIQSAGINDSTQREAFPYVLAQSMGLTPGVDWFYPSFNFPGCPAPYTNPLTGARVGGATAPCYLRDLRSVHPNMNNVGLYAVRLAQVLDVTALPFPPSDTIGGLAQLAFGSVNPIDMVTRQNPTFITVELGANDLLRVATYGSAALMTSVDSFQNQLTRIADRIDSTGASVAIANVPDVTTIPFLTRGLMFYCLKNGCAPLGIPATVPYSLATFLPAANCAPSAFGPGGVGDSTMVGFPTTGGITKVLTGGGAVQLDCAAGTVLINLGAGFIPPPAALFPVLTITPDEYAAARNRAIAFNTFIQTLATARGYALVDLNAALQTLAANPANVPPFPQFSGPGPLFGPYFSLDGFHPNKAGQHLVAQLFAAAINAKFGTTLTVQ